MRTLPTKALVVVGVLAALLLAGVASRYASDRPDGLERVAEDQGFLDQAEQAATAGGPLADYQLGDSGDPTVPGVVGVLVVLLLTSGTVYVVRRGSHRRRQDAAESADRS